MSSRMRVLDATAEKSVPTEAKAVEPSTNDAASARRVLIGRGRGYESGGLRSDREQGGGLHYHTSVRVKISSAVALVLLLFALDAFAKKVGLVAAPAPPEQPEEESPASNEDIPGFEPPGEGNVWGSGTSATAESDGAGAWGGGGAPAQSGTMLTDEAPSFGTPTTKRAR